MSRDSVWERLKKDETKVYGEPIMDAFLKVVENIEPRHMRDLDGRQKGLLKPEVRLNASETVEEAKAAMKDGAKRLNAAAWHASSRGNIEVLKMLLHLKGDNANTLMSALNGAGKSGPMEIVRYIVDRARDLNVSLESSGINNAAMRGRTEVFEYLYDEVYVKGNGWTTMDASDILSLAIRANSTRVAKIAMRGVDDDELEGLLDFAQRKGRSEIAHMIQRRLDRHILADRDEI